MSPTVPRNAATVAVDIEVVAPEWHELDEATRGYLLERERKSGKPQDEIKTRLALVLGLGHVVAIGIWNLSEQRGAVLLEGEGGEWLPWPNRTDGAYLFRGSEREMLAAFWQRMKGWGRVVTFHGRGFDGPVLMTRSAILGVAPTRNLAGKRWEQRSHLDLSEIFTFQGAVRDHMSLEYWCRRFGIESPKSTLDGSQVDKTYRAGELERIGDYCLRDARATAELYQRVESTLVPLFD